MENSVFIKILEYGEDCGLEGAHWDGLLKKMQNDGIVSKDDELSTEESNRLFKLFDECYDKADGAGGTHTHRLLKTEYYFRLIEYRELQDSRKASTSANKNAFIAIGISIFAILTGVISTAVQLSSSVSLESEQLRALVDASKPPTLQSVSINRPQFNEFISTIKPPASQKVAINHEQLAKLLTSIESSKPKEVYLTKRQMTELLSTINLNKPIQPTAETSAN